MCVQKVVGLLLLMPCQMLFLYCTALKMILTFLTASGSARVQIWDQDDLTPLTSIDEGLTCPVQHIAITEDNTFLVAGKGQDKIITIDTCLLTSQNGLVSKHL